MPFLILAVDQQTRFRSSSPTIVTSRHLAQIVLWPVAKIAAEPCDAVTDHIAHIVRAKARTADKLLIIIAARQKSPA